MLVFYACKRENTTVIMPSSNVSITLSLISQTEEGVRTMRM